MNRNKDKNGRKAITREIETNILTKSRRQCCLCVFLDGDNSVKNGQLAHIDHNSSNSREDNLVYLCLEHHNQYDSVYRQSKKITSSEVKYYKSSLYKKLGTGDREWKITIEGSLNSFPNSKIVELLEQFKKVTKDPTIVIKEIAQGSVVLRMAGKLNSYQLLKQMHEEGDLSDALGVRVQKVQLKKVVDLVEMINLSEQHMMHGEFKSAIMMLNKVLAIEPELALAWFLKGGSNLEMHYKYGQGSNKVSFLAEAESSTLKAIELAPGNGHYISQQSAILFEKGEVSGAVELLDEVLVMEPENGMAWCNKGIVLHRLGQFNSAIAALEKAIEYGYGPAKEALIVAQTSLGERRL